MKKTVTKEEVERVLEQYLTPITKEPILNELFPPYFNVGQYAIRVWPSGKETLGKAVLKNGQLYWQCEESYNGEGGVYKGELYGLISNYTNRKKGSKLRHATPEEIAAAEWEEGKPYKVWFVDGCAVRISSDKVGHFYVGGNFEGESVKHDKYEKIDFTKKLRMTEEEAEELEDDRVTSCWTTPNYVYWNSDTDSLVAVKGYYFKTNEGGTEVTLHKKESC